METNDLDLKFAFSNKLLQNSNNFDIKRSFLM